MVTIYFIKFTEKIDMPSAMMLEEDVVLGVLRDFVSDSSKGCLPKGFPWAILIILNFCSSDDFGSQAHLRYDSTVQ